MSFDLDIRNYTIKNIETLFNLKNDFDYTPADIEMKELQLREQLISSGKVNGMYTAALIEFLNKAKLWLMTLRCKTYKNIPTTLPNNLALDSVRYINSDETLSRTNELIKKEPVEYINSFNNEFYAGTLNPLNNRIITKCLAIDSRFRDDPFTTQSSSFYVHLPTKLTKVVSMQLSAIEVPIIAYSISAQKGNNFFRWRTDVAYNSSYDAYVLNWSTVTIPDGNYTGYDLITIINGLMNPVDSNGISIYKTGSIQPDGTVRVNTDESSFQNSLAELSLDITGNGSGSGRIVVQPTAYALDPVNNLQVLSFNMDFSVDANGTPDGIDITKKIGYLLGFKKARYAGINYFSDSLCQTYLTNYVYLCVYDFTNNSNQMFISTQAKAAIDKNTLARISFRGQSYYTLVAQDDYSIITEPRKYFGPVDIQTLQVRLLDEFGRVVDMQNVDFSFCLTFKLLYDL